MTAVRPLVDVEASVIRSAFKRGIKRVFGMEAAPAVAPAPAPVWKTPLTAAQAPEPPSVPAAASASRGDVKPASPVEVLAEAPAGLPADDSESTAVSAAVSAEAEAPAPVVSSAVVDTDDTAGSAFTLAAVQEIMDEMVRPALQGDGGDITLLRIENNDIYVKLVGSCSTCPSSIMTMKMGVEALLKEEFPAMNNLIQVD